MAILKTFKGKAYHAVLEDLPDQAMMKLTISGQYRAGSNKTLVQATNEEAQARGYHKCLVDYREAEVTMSTLEVFKRPKEFSGVGLPRDFKSAMLFDPDKTALDIDFVETVFYNRGWLLRCFLRTMMLPSPG